VKEPDPFSGSSPNELHAFIFQYQIYFCACEVEFSEDTKKVFFAISYLREVVLDYFEPFINELDPYQGFDFLENWSAFVQKLSNVLGNSRPSIEKEDKTINPLTFPSCLENPSPLLGNILGPDGQLTLAKRQCRLIRGLCMRYSQKGHLAQACLCQSQRSVTTIGTHTA